MAGCPLGPGSVLGADSDRGDQIHRSHRPSLCLPHSRAPALLAVRSSRLPVTLLALILSFAASQRSQGRAQAPTVAGAGGCKGTGEPPEEYGGAQGQERLGVRRFTLGASPCTSTQNSPPSTPLGLVPPPHSPPLQRRPHSGPLRSSAPSSPPPRRLHPGTAARGSHPRWGACARLGGARPGGGSARPGRARPSGARALEAGVSSVGGRVPEGEGAGWGRALGGPTLGRVPGSPPRTQRGPSRPRAATIQPWRRARGGARS